MRVEALGKAKIVKVIQIFLFLFFFLKCPGRTVTPHTSRTHLTLEQSARVFGCWLLTYTLYNRIFLDSHQSFQLFVPFEKIPGRDQSLSLLMKNLRNSLLFPFFCLRLHIFLFFTHKRPRGPQILFSALFAETNLRNSHAQVISQTTMSSVFGAEHVWPLVLNQGISL